jgi:glycosyltransferase involved in cell wall biosynthesis
MASDSIAVEPRVSIFMPTYNHAAFIEQAIEGVISQEAVFPYVLHIGDDCSTDGTREICQRYAAKYPDKIVFYSSETNLGATANSRRLRDACRSEYLAICEGDDYWTDRQKLKLQVEALDAHPQWSGCFHLTRVKHDDATIADEFLPPHSISDELTLNEIAAENCIGTCSVMYRQSLLPKVPDWFYTSVLGDWPMHILYASFGPLGYLNQEMAVYRLHKGGMWSTLDRVERTDHSLKSLCLLEQQSEGLVQSAIAAGRREFLRRMFQRHDEHIARLNKEIDRLKKIEDRYRALQLHRAAAFGKWLKQWIGQD